VEDQHQQRGCKKRRKLPDPLSRRLERGKRTWKGGEKVGRKKEQKRRLGRFLPAGGLEGFREGEKNQKIEIMSSPCGEEKKWGGTGLTILLTQSYRPAGKKGEKCVRGRVWKNREGFHEGKRGEWH